ncbi:MAG: metallophosphoesterase family protein [Lachnospiraceae bacterium]|nr:metallophosphoesterase family protein [Lachnospiraceae bacterium]
MLYAVLADIHGNMHALNNVVSDMSDYDINGVILLGDLIDYGMQSDETVAFIRDRLGYDIICNIWGNHERAIMLEDYSGFSSQRGVDCAKYTASVLKDETKLYLSSQMDVRGMSEFDLAGKKCLAVHGALGNLRSDTGDNGLDWIVPDSVSGAENQSLFWESVSPENVNGDYRNYDIVFSGHSHYSHVFSVFYDADDPDMRNKHAVTFINPGSVGQPRNHNSNAQYALLDADSLSVQLRSVPYDIEAARALYDGRVDSFYKDRLLKGI